MNDDIKTFVLLKYEILTSDYDTWDRCEPTYPAEVKTKWAWRCAADVEHIAKGYPEAEECIRVAKLCRDGKATIKELNKAWRGIKNTIPAGHHYATYATGASLAAANNHYYGVGGVQRAGTSYATHTAAHRTAASYAVAAYCDATAAYCDAAYALDAYCDVTVADQEEKWKLYIGWLFEELCAYEQLKENENE